VAARVLWANAESEDKKLGYRQNASGSAPGTGADWGSDSDTRKVGARQRPTARPPAFLAQGRNRSRRGGNLRQRHRGQRTQTQR